MLDAIRKASTTWYFKAFFALLAIMFGFMWGIGDVVTRMGDQGSQTIVKIGSHKITAREFEYAIAREAEALYHKTGERLDRKQTRAAGLDAKVIQQLINDTLFELECDRLNILISDDMVRKSLFSMTLFQDQDGHFQKDRFLSMIQKAGFSEQEYINLYRKDLAKQEIIKAIQGGIVAPDSLLTPLYKWQKEERIVKAFIIESKDGFVTDTPTEEGLHKFYVDNMKTFKTQESRTLQALVLDVASLRKASASQQDATEKLHKLSTEIEDMLAGGATFEETSKKHQLTLIKLDNVTQDGKPDAFSESSQKPSLSDVENAIIKQAFFQEKLIPGDLVETEDHQKAFIVQVDDIFPSRQRSFNEIKSKLTPQWKRHQAILLTKKYAEAAVEELHKGTSLMTLSQKFKSPILTLKANRSGLIDKKNLNIPQAFIAKIYNLTKNGATYSAFPQKETTNYIVAQVDHISQPKIISQNDSLKEFQGTLESLLLQDFIDGYLNALQAKFPIEFNKRYFQ